MWGIAATNEAGVTLAHEHLFVDLRNQFTEFEDPNKARVGKEKLKMSNLGVVSSAACRAFCAARTTGLWRSGWRGCGSWGERRISS